MRLKAHQIDRLPRAETPSTPPAADSGAAIERLAQAVETLAGSVRPPPPRAWSFAMERDANNVLIGVVATPIMSKG